MGMSDQKICEVLDRYEALPVVDGNAKLVHLKGMIPKMRAFLVEGRREKVSRWLGFMQGVLYALDVYTVEEMANHNRPDEE